VFYVGDNRTNVSWGRGASLALGEELANAFEISGRITGDFFDLSVSEAGYVGTFLPANFYRYALRRRRHRLLAWYISLEQRFGAQDFIAEDPGVSIDNLLAHKDEHPALRNIYEQAANADVLVLGNSRIQIALSNQPTEDWFAAAKARYYLMGFSYDENVAYVGELLRKMQPRASVFIINVDDFFRSGETVAAKAILHDPDAENRYEWKRFAQKLHRPICETFGVLCGKRYAIFRSRETGAYYRIPHDEPVFPQNAVSYDQNVDPALVKDGAALAIINREPTDMDGRADVIIHAEIGAVLREIVP